MLLGYGYMRNNLVHLGGYPTHRDIADTAACRDENYANAYVPI